MGGSSNTSWSWPLTCLVELELKLTAALDAEYASEVDDGRPFSPARLQGRKHT